MKSTMILTAILISSAVFAGVANAGMIYFCGAPSVSSENGVSKLELPVYQGPPIGSDAKTPPVIVGLWGYLGFPGILQ